MALTRNSHGLNTPPLAQEGVRSVVSRQDHSRLDARPPSVNDTRVGWNELRQRSGEQAPSRRHRRGYRRQYRQSGTDRGTKRVAQAAAIRLELAEFAEDDEIGAGRNGPLDGRAGFDQPGRVEIACGRAVSEILRYRYDCSGGKVTHGAPFAGADGFARCKLDDAGDLVALSGGPEREVIEQRSNRRA